MIKNNSLSFAIVLSSIILGLFFYISRDKDQTVKVVGYAVQSFESDIVQWNFNLSQNVGLSDMKNGYKNLNRQIEDFKSILKSSDLNYDELTFKPIRINDMYDRNGNIVSKKLSQEVSIVSKEMSKVEKFSTDPIEFIERNILFEYSNINYFSTNLDSIKKELLGKAVLNAKERAEEILNAAGNKVGDLKFARSGVFQITEPLSTEVAGYGLHSTSTKKKNIKVTVSAAFVIE